MFDLLFRAVTSGAYLGLINKQPALNALPGRPSKLPLLLPPPSKKC